VYAHGHVESTAAYANRWDRFEWPPTAEGSDPERIRAVFDSVVAFASNFGNLMERLTDNWTLIKDTALGEHARQSYGHFRYYVEHHARGRGVEAPFAAVDPATAAEWFALPARPDGAEDISH
jgi:hypothetical protein